MAGYVAHWSVSEHSKGSANIKGSTENEEASGATDDASEFTLKIADLTHLSTESPKSFIKAALLSEPLDVHGSEGRGPEETKSVIGWREKPKACLDDETVEVYQLLCDAIRGH